MPSRQAIGRVFVADRETGSAFAVSSYLVLTAFHCVRGSMPDEPTNERIDFVLAGIDPLRAAVAEWCAMSDVAMLRLDDPIPAGWEPFVLSCPDESFRGESFQSPGFPVDRPFTGSPLTADGRLLDPVATMDEGIEALELFCKQVAAGRDPRGFSGAPVLMRLRWNAGEGDRTGWAAVGVVRWAQPFPEGEGVGYGGALFACPTSTPVRRWSALASHFVQGQPAGGGGERARVGRYLIDFANAYHSAEDFVGRERLMVEIQRFAEEHDRGYVHLQASAGLGKTAIASRFAALEQAPVFFADASLGTTHPDQCLNHLSAELIIRHGLTPDQLDEESGRDSTTLNTILGGLTNHHEGVIWLVVDGLDEADTPHPGTNPLLLPTRLPAGVFVLVTSREPASLLLTGPDTPIRLIELSSDDSVQRSDLERYVAHRLATDARLRDAVAAVTPPVSPGTLGRHISEAAEGNFMYVTYVLADAAAGDLELHKLPARLAGYYEIRFWSPMQAAQDAGWHEWDTLYRPVLERLAVAAEPVTADWLESQVGRPASEITERVLRPWRRFLRTDLGDHGEEWRIVHRSFADFLGSKINLEASHAAVARKLATAEDAYAHRHRTHHLRSAGQLPELLDLVRDPAWQDAQLAADPTGRFLLHDFDESWLAVEALDAAELTFGRLAPKLGDEAWSALAGASVRSRMQSVPPNLLTALVQEGLWTLERAHETVKQAPNPGYRARSLLMLARFEPALVDEALDAARDIEWPLHRKAEVTAEVALQIPEGRQHRILESLLEELVAADPYSGPHAVARIVRVVPDDLLPRVADIARNARATIEQVVLFLALGERLGQKVVDDPVATSALEAEGLPTSLLQAFAVDASDPESTVAATEVLDELDAWPSPFYGALLWAGSQRNARWVIEALAPRLDVAGLTRCVEQARNSGGFALDALEAVAAAFAHRGAYGAALDLLDFLDDESRATIITILSELLPEALVSRVLDAAMEIRNPYWRAEAIGSLIPRLAERERGRYLEDAVPPQRLADQAAQSEVLGSLAPNMRPDAAAQALDLLTRTSPGYGFAATLEALVPVLPDNRLQSALGLTNRLKDELGDAVRAAVIARLSGGELIQAARDEAYAPSGPRTARALGRALDNDGRERVLGVFEHLEVLEIPGSPKPQDAQDILLAMASTLSEEQTMRAAILLDELGARRLEALRTMNLHAAGDESTSAELVDITHKLQLRPWLVVDHVVTALISVRRFDDALALALALDDEALGETIGRTGDTLPDELVLEAVELCLGISDWELRLKTLGLVAHRLDYVALLDVCDRLGRQGDALAETVAEESRMLARRQRRASLLGLQSLLPIDDRASSVAALDDWLAGSEWKDVYALLGAIAPIRDPFPADVAAVLHRGLSKILHALSAQSRASALQHLAPLNGVVVGLGGNAGAADLAEAIMEIGDRWP
jgi:hypothetical protein